MKHYLQASLIVILQLLFSIDNAYSQCTFFSGNTNENFSTSGLCGPVTVTWDVQFSFVAPINPARVMFRFAWNDSANTITDVTANCVMSNTQCSPSSGPQVFTYPSSSTDCEYFPTVTLAWDNNSNGVIDAGELCSPSNATISRTIRSYGLDNSGSGNLSINPSLTQQCVGIPLSGFQFQDASIPNCNSTVSSLPNELSRTVQFIYGTTNEAGPYIPNVSIDTGGGSVQITNSVGAIINQFRGPIIQIPPFVTIADLNELSYPISYGSNNTIGQIFEVTLRNWNTCNQYDSIPFDGNPPSNILDGDNLPVTTTAKIEIIGPTVANAGIDQEICGGSTFLDGNINLVGNGTWTQISGPASANINTSNDPLSGVSVLNGNYGTYEFEWLINLGSCVSMDTVEIIFNSPTTVPVTGPNTTVCGLSTNLLANPIPVGTGVWRQIGGASNFSIADSTNPTTSVTASTYGSYIVQWRSQNANCPLLTDPITVTFDEDPSIANAGSDIIDCGDSTTLMAIAPSVGNGVWTVSSGPVGSNPTFSNIGDPATTFLTDSFGTYQLNWTVSNGACSSNSDAMQITLVENPSAPNAGLDQQICGLTTSLSANVPTVGTGVWQLVSGPSNLVFSDSLNPQSSVAASGFGTYILEWQTKNANCQVLTDQVQVNFFENPSLANAGNDQQICGTSTVLNADLVNIGSGQWSLFSSPAGSNPVISNVLNRNSTFISDSFGDYQLVWTVNNGACNSNTDTVLISFNKSPGIPVAGQDQQICGLTANLLANSPDAGSGQWVQISGPSGLNIVNPANPQTQLNAVNYGTYNLEWRFTNGICPMVSDQIQIRFDQNPTTAIAGADTLICGNSTSLNASNLLVGNGLWNVVTSPMGSNTVLSNIASSNSNLLIDSFGVYVLTWTATNGACASSTDNVKISFAELPDFNVVSQTGTRCFNSCDASAILQGVNGTAPYFFTWSGSDDREGNTANDLCGGSYTLSVTDKNGCSSSNAFNVNSPSAISANINVTGSTCGGFNGALSISPTGGTGNLTAQWNSGYPDTPSISGIPAGLYVATVKDQNECVELFTAIVNDNSSGLLSSNVTPISCVGASNGAIDLSASGVNNTYLWSNGSRSEDILNLESGPYYVIVNDTALDCVEVLETIVPEPDEIEIDVNVVNSTCGQSDGAASVIITGGNGGNIINWSSGGSGSSVSGLLPGVYTVTVNDFKGCSKTKYFTVSDKGAPQVFTDSVVDVVCGSNIGAIYVSTTGNSVQHNYLWSSGDTTEDLIASPIGIYNLQVTDTLGCQSFYANEIEQVSAGEAEICMVTVDSATNYNEVIWKRPSNVDELDFYKIYRESTSTGVYQLIGTHPAAAIGLFQDTISNPLIKSYRYKLSVVDTCGVESELSEAHKTIHLVQSLSVQPTDVNLIWDDYEGFSYLTFYIYRNSTQNGWELIDSVASNVNSFTDTPPLRTDPALFYAVDVKTPSDCDPNKARSFNRARSNPSSALFSPPAINSIQERLTDHNNLLYPNPTDDKLYTQSIKDLSESRVTIYSVEGILVLEAEGISLEQGLSVKGLPAGMYYLSIDSHGFKETMKFVKE